VDDTLETYPDRISRQSHGLVTQASLPREIVVQLSVGQTDELQCHGELLTNDGEQAAGNRGAGDEAENDDSEQRSCALGLAAGGKQIKDFGHGCGLRPLVMPSRLEIWRYLVSSRSPGLLERTVWSFQQAGVRWLGTPDAGVSAARSPQH